jgi:hypothetical protein
MNFPTAQKRNKLKSLHCSLLNQKVKASEGNSLFSSGHVQSRERDREIDCGYLE